MAPVAEASIAVPRAGVVTPAVPVVYFGNDWFAENRTSSHHIARCLAQWRPLLYVEGPGLRAPQATPRDLRKLFRKLVLSLRRPRRLGDQMWHVTVPQIPFRRLPAVKTLNRWIAQGLLRRAMRLAGFRRPVLWFVAPHMGSLAGRLGERLVVYYCIDDYPALPGMDPSGIARMDAELTERADQVFVSSLPLLERKRLRNPSTRYSPHGVDVELFARAADPSLEPPESARNLARPVVGFFGLIEAWIDLQLLQFLAESRPRWTFLLVGRLAVDAGPLASLPNVVFAGARPYAELPRWARAFDVAILPYRRNRQVWNANPLKLREYLATGKPVVSVSTPEIDRFAHVVYLAQSPEEFRRRIEQALAADCDLLRARRRASVSGMSWEARAREALDVVEQRLARSCAEVVP
jgi:glycosyltransferase involved in cell wall biosynthesis